LLEIGPMELIVRKTCRRNLSCAPTGAFHDEL
jgi:hypothetical protein